MRLRDRIEERAARKSSKALLPASFCAVSTSKHSRTEISKRDTQRVSAIPVVRDGRGAMLTLSESTAEASQHPFGANDRVLGFEVREHQFPVLHNRTGGPDMPVYDVIEIIGSSSESWEKGRRQCGRTSLQISPRSSHRRNRKTRFATGREGKGGGLSREDQTVVQIRGLLNRRCAWYTGIELDTHGREATLPALTLIREDQTPRGKCCASFLSIRDPGCVKTQKSKRDEE